MEKALQFCIKAQEMGGMGVVIGLSQMHYATLQHLWSGSTHVGLFLCSGQRAIDMLFDGSTAKDTISEGENQQKCKIPQAHHLKARPMEES
ncbi:hypothetical protein Ancab_004240 [Ancistrocladus abbreviatus]